VHAHTSTVMSREARSIVSIWESSVFQCGSFGFSPAYR